MRTSGQMFWLRMKKAPERERSVTQLDYQQGCINYCTVLSLMSCIIAERLEFIHWIRQKSTGIVGMWACNKVKNCTSKDEGDSQDNEDPTVQSHTEGGPGRCRLMLRKKNSFRNTSNAPQCSFSIMIYTYT